MGIGTEQELEEAMRWYTRAAAQGDQRAKQRMYDLRTYHQAQRRDNGQNLRSQNSDCRIA